MDHTDLEGLIVVTAQHVLDWCDVNRRVFLRTLFTPRAWKQTNKLNQMELSFPLLQLDSSHTVQVGLSWQHLLFSLTRQNSRVLWLSSVESKSTATFGSVCFSRRYMGPVDGATNVPLVHNIKISWPSTDQPDYFSFRSNSFRITYCKHYLSPSESLSSSSVLSGEFPSLLPSDCPQGLERTHEQHF